MLSPISQNDVVTTVCQWGHCRSVAMARHLHGLNIKAVPCGVVAASFVQIQSLASVSHAIVCMQPDYADFIRNVVGIQHHRLLVFDVGPDRWVNPYHAELQLLVKDLFESYQSNPRAYVKLC